MELVAGFLVEEELVLGVVFAVVLGVVFGVVLGVVLGVVIVVGLVLVVVGSAADVVASARVMEGCVDVMGLVLVVAALVGEDEVVVVVGVLEGTLRLAVTPAALDVVEAAATLIFRPPADSVLVEGSVELELELSTELEMELATVGEDTSLDKRVLELATLVELESNDEALELVKIPELELELEGEV